MQDGSNAINSKSYWNKRFGSGDWAVKGGYSQTRLFAESQVIHFGINKDFSGSICDFGCGAGDAFPVYKKEFPRAKLIGVDFSDDAIKLCIERYGNLAEFYCTESRDAPSSDVIICSNVLEHIDNDSLVLRNLLERCATLYVIVPYKENPLSIEHLREYNLESFNIFNPVTKKIILSKGWSRYGVNLWYHIYIKNIARFLLGKPVLKQQRQIIYEFRGKFKFRDSI